MPTCSIIIPVHNHASLTRQCLKALFRSPPYHVSTEVIVVDDASTDSTPRVLDAFHDDIRVVAHETNRGFAESCNDGAAIATGDFLLFLNNDILPQVGWLDALTAYAEQHPQAAIVGSKLLYPNDTIQHAGIAINRDGRAFHIYVGFPANHPAVNRSRRFQAVTGGCALIRRQPFLCEGGFDTAFRNSYEDVDLCLRLGAKGYEVHYCHESVLYHLESVSREGRTAEEARNAQLFDSRWGAHLRPDDWNYYLDDGLIRLIYTGCSPLHLEVSPHFAVVMNEEHGYQADRLLDAHARHLFTLLKENIRLTVRLQDAEEELAASRSGQTPITHEVAM